MVSKWVGYNLLINGIYWGYDLLTNLLLTSWDILVETGGVLNFGSKSPKKVSGSLSLHCTICARSKVAIFRKWSSHS